MKYRVDVCVAPGLTYECQADDALVLKKDDDVIIQCDRYEDAGRVVRTYVQGISPRVADAALPPEPADAVADAADEAEATGADTPEPPAPEPASTTSNAHAGREEPRERENARLCRRLQGQKPPMVQRLMGPGDMNRQHETEVREKSLLKAAAQKIRDHRLDMKVINLHSVFDKSLLILQFSADGRVDFRELLRDLSRTVHMRVELRQIGVRDEAALQGGIGCCGRPYCCATFLGDFQSINVRMAKEQGLSLNPANISGACGRLKCCLRYEAEGYRDMLRSLPKIGSFCDSPEGPGKVVDLNPLTRRVRVNLQPKEGEPYRQSDFDAAELKPRPAPQQMRKPGGRPPAAPGGNPSPAPPQTQQQPQQPPQPQPQVQQPAPSQQPSQPRLGGPPQGRRDRDRNTGGGGGERPRSGGRDGGRDRDRNRDNNRGRERNPHQRGGGAPTAPREPAAGPPRPAPSAAAPASPPAQGASDAGANRGSDS